MRKREGAASGWAGTVWRGKSTAKNATKAARIGKRYGASMMRLQTGDEGDDNPVVTHEGVFVRETKRCRKLDMYRRMDIIQISVARP